MLWRRQQSGSVETYVGYTRVELWREDVGKSWQLATYNENDKSLHLSKNLHTRSIDKAKRRAIKFLVANFIDRRDTISAWLKQMRDFLDPPKSMERIRRARIRQRKELR